MSYIFSLLWKDCKWYIDQHKKLVVVAGLQECHFVILTMKRLYKKTIDGETDTWWGFNLKRILLRESNFDIDVSGLYPKINEKVKAIRKNRDALLGNFSFSIVYEQQLL